MTPAKLLARIRQVFPDADPADIKRLLDTYAGPERLRVQLAIVKLSDEDRRDSPRHYVDTACHDHATYSRGPSPLGSSDPTGSHSR